MTKSETARGIPPAALAIACALALLGAPAPAAAQVPNLDGRVDPIYYTDATTFDFQGFVPEAQATLYGLDNPAVDATYVWVAWVISKNFNDASYTTTHPGGGKHTSWPKGHSGVNLPGDPGNGDLAESDLQRLLLFNTCGEVVVDATMDLLDAVAGTPSGYGTGMDEAESVKNSINDVPGVADDWTLFAYRDSLDSNLNDHGYCSGGSCSCGAATDLFTESPFFADEPNYVPEAGCAYWEYDLVFELRVDRRLFVTAACPEGGQLPIAPDPIELHASPSKAGVSPVALGRSPSSLGDRVWLDVDRDGVQDLGEPGISNVVVNLYTDVDGDGAIDPDVAVIDGLVDLDGDGNPGGVPDADDDGSVYGFQIIDGRVDVNGDGVVDAADDGSFLSLRVIDGYLDMDYDLAANPDAGDDGVLPGDSLISTTITGADGLYLFTQLGSGNYLVDVVESTLPAGLSATFGTGDTHSTVAAVVDGGIDVDRDGDVDAADDGFVDGVRVENGLLDLDGDGVGGETNGDDSGSLNGVNVIDGRFDLDSDGAAGAADDGTVSGLDRTDNTTIKVLNADIDLNRDGAVNAADDGFLDGFEVIDARLDINGDGVITTADDGSFNGVTVIDGRLDEEGDGDVDNQDDGLIVDNDSEDDYLVADFGYAPTNPFLAAIGDFVWSDADDDGVQDPGEPGIEGVTVRLLRDDDGDGFFDDLAATTTTRADGLYLFTGLAPGDYVVEVVDGTGTPLDGYAPTSGPQSVGGSVSPPITVIGGTVYLNADFGWFRAGLGTIENQVWLESDQDGLYEPATESGLVGVGLDLFQDVLGNGFVDEYDVIDGELDLNNDGAVDADDDGLVFGLGVFGTLQYNSAAVIDGRLDLDRDGAVTAADDGTWNGIGVIDGRLDVDGGGVGASDDAARDFVIASTVTDSLGQYRFTGLVLDDGGGDGDADYLVRVEDVDQVLRDFFKTPDGIPDTDNNSQPLAYDVALTAAAPAVDYADFGYFLPPGGTPADPDGLVGDTIWYDLDGNGVQDAGEAGIPGVTVQLLRKKGSGFDPVGFAVTDANGNYQFPHLTMGGGGGTQYDVLVVASNFQTGGALAGLEGTNQPDNRDSTVPNLSSSNNVDLTLDFGYRFDDASPRYDIGDFVWLDADRDGFQDPSEVGIEGVTLDLLAADGTVLGTATTDANGLYLFPDLADNATYTVRVTDTAGVLTGYDLTSGLDEITVTLAGADDLDVDFGYAIATATGSIGDTVWLDVDPDGDGPLRPDGVQGPGETGIPGVTVNLWLDDGDGVFEPGTGDTFVASTVTTDVDGRYLFDNLAAGSYFVDVVEATLPPSLSITFGNLEVIDGGADLDLDGDVDADDDGTFQGIPVIDGRFDVDLDGDVDADDDGTLNGIAIIDGTLDVDGDAAAPPDTGDDRNVFGLVPLSEGEDHRDADFGYTPNAGTGAVGDFVWHDVDADGIQDPEEVGIAGVELILYDDTATEIARTTTGPEGFYLFTGLAPGRYGVDFDPTTVPAGFSTTPTNTGGETLYSVDDLQAGDLITFLDYGFVGGPAGTIGNLVWLDEDDDGVFDVGEQGIEGVTLSLYQDVNENGAIDGVDIIDGELDADGSGTVDAADDGTYGGAYAILDGRLDMDGDGDVDTDDDGTLRGIAVIDGQLDVDGDGVVNGDADDDGSLGEPILATTTTDSSGNYLFTGLPLDDGTGDGDFDFLVDVTDIDKVLPLLHQTFGTPGLDDNGQSDPYAVDLASGSDTDLTADFSYAPATQNVVGSIGTVVWHDVDGDGFRDGVVIDGRLDIDGDGDVDGDDDGTFNGVAVVDGRLDFDGDGNPGPVPDPDDDGTMAGFSIIDGEVDIDGDGTAGETGGDDDGLIGGEIGIQGVRIDLWLDDGDGVFEPFAGDNFLRSITTDVNGEYEFTGLPEDTYHVDVNDLGADGVPATGDEVLAGFLKTSGTAGLDNNSQDDAYTVTLTSAAPSNFTADFGYEADDCPTCFVLAIRGTTFEDVEVTYRGRDPNGVLDVLDGLVPSMEVFLYRVVGGVPQLIGTTFSDINGDYEFTNLPPGDYIVSADPSGTSVQGYLQTTQTTTGGVQPVTLVDMDSEDNDFGFFDGGISATPVTLAFFRAEGGGGSVRFEWMTATELGNVAFNLWVWEGEGRAADWRRVNAQMIPSAVLDSIDPQTYRYEADGVTGELFMIEDVDARGTSRFHGPFTLGEDHGHRPAGFEAIDWPGIRRGHLARKAARGVERKALARLKARADFGTVHLTVAEDGVYRVTYEQLLAAGLDLARAPKNQIALTSFGEPVPIHVEAPKGNFGPGAWIEFVGESIRTLYTRTNVYTLQVDADLAARVELDRRRVGPRDAVAPFYLETATTERDRQYSSLAANGDPWYDAFILAFTSPASKSFDFELEGHVAGAAPVEMFVSLWGFTGWPDAAPDHHLVVEVNGEPLWDETFDGYVDHPVRFEVPSRLLEEGTNTLRVVLPGDTGVEFDAVNLDRYSVTYPRRFAARDGALRFTAAAEAFEVSGLPSPDVRVYRSAGGKVARLEQAEVRGTPGAYSVRFPGSRRDAGYLVVTPGAVRAPGIEPVRQPVDIASGEAEYLIVTHPDFLGDDLERLAAARAAQGLSVQIVDVEEILAQYGFGIFDPEAIRAYVAYAAANKGTRYLLLVGGDTRDYLDHLGQGAISFIPSIYAPTGDIVRFAPADALYADVDDDGLPDLAVGRFPVRTPAELAVMVDKTLEYDALGHRRSAVLAADGYDYPSGFDFALTSDQLASFLPADWQRRRVYLDELPLADARDLLLAEMNAGPALTSYMGHSGPIRWTFDGLFWASDAAALTNEGAPTVVTQWGCWTTYYVSPSYNTLAHRLLLDGDQGAAAVLGATTLTEARSERAIGRAVFAGLFAPGKRLGDAVLEGKRALAEDGGRAADDVLLGWTLLGDPALVLNP